MVEPDMTPRAIALDGVLPVAEIPESVTPEKNSVLVGGVDLNDFVQSVDLADYEEVMFDRLASNQTITVTDIEPTDSNIIGSYELNGRYTECTFIYTGSSNPGQPSG